MQRIATVGSLDGLAILALTVSVSVSEDSTVIKSPEYILEIPKYDADGTWNYTTSKRWADCIDAPFEPGEGTTVPVTIGQSGIKFRIQFPSAEEELWGRVIGNRYQVVYEGSHSTHSLIWNLDLV